MLIIRSNLASVNAQAKLNLRCMELREVVFMDPTFKWLNLIDFMKPVTLQDKNIIKMKSYVDIILSLKNILKFSFKTCNLAPQVIKDNIISNAYKIKINV